MIFLFIPLFLFSLNLSDILTHPKSYVRDFYLTEFMKETNSTILAYKAYNSLYKKRPFFHLKILAKKDNLFNDIYKCINVKKEYINEVDISCIQEGGLSLKTISTLNKKILINLYSKLANGKIKKAYFSLYLIAKVLGVISPKIKRTTTVTGTVRREPRLFPSSFIKRTVEVAAIPTLTISLPIRMVAIRSAGFWRNFRISCALLLPSLASLSNLNVLREKNAVSDAENRAERKSRTSKKSSTIKQFSPQIS
jgi:hypothetical protein